MEGRGGAVEVVRGKGRGRGGVGWAGVVWVVRVGWVVSGGYRVGCHTCNTLSS